MIVSFCLEAENKSTANYTVYLQKHNKNEKNIKIFLPTLHFSSIALLSIAPNLLRSSKLSTTLFFNEKNIFLSPFLEKKFTAKNPLSLPIIQDHDKQNFYIVNKQLTYYVIH